MKMRTANKDIATFGHNSWVMTTRADISRWLTVFKLSINWTRQESVTLTAYTNLTIFVLSKGPNECLFVNDLLWDYSDVFSVILRICGSHVVPLMYWSCILVIKSWGSQLSITYFLACSVAESWISRIPFDIVLLSLFIRIWWLAKADMLSMPHLLAWMWLWTKVTVPFSWVWVYPTVWIALPKSGCGLLCCIVRDNWFNLSIWWPRYRFVSKLLHIFDKSGARIWIG